MYSYLTNESMSKAYSRTLLYNLSVTDAGENMKLGEYRKESSEVFINLDNEASSNIFDGVAYAREYSWVAGKTSVVGRDMKFRTTMNSYIGIVPTLI
jgi:hypothetical protein